MTMDNHTIRCRAELPSYQTKDTSLICEIAHPSGSAARNQSLAEATLRLGRSTQAHFHARSEEIYYILSGRGEFCLGEHGAPSTCEAGTAIIIAPGIKHQIRCVGEDDLVFLCACAPPYSHDDTFECEALLPEQETKNAASST
jgi:mannose-6-phosphate isomerase-like protein (cupin superfamily)